MVSHHSPTSTRWNTRQGTEWVRVVYRPRVRAFKWRGLLIKSLYEISSFDLAQIVASAIR